MHTPLEASPMATANSPPALTTFTMCAGMSQGDGAPAQASAATDRGLIR